MKTMNHIDKICAAAKQSQYEMSQLTGTVKNSMLAVIAKSLIDNADAIISANKIDIKNCQKPAQFIDRLTLTTGRIKDMADGLTALISLEDPVGIESEEWTVRSGLKIKKRSVPIGVLGIIYEARPNVTADAVGLCIKSGNAAVLRGSKDAIESNKAIVEFIKIALKNAGYIYECVQLVEDTTREGAEYLMKLNKYIDVLIPRGSAGLIQSVINNSTVPVIETGTGNCHVYIEKSADMTMAKNILINSKTRRTSVCNSAESMLIDRSAIKHLPELLQALFDSGVNIKGDAETKAIFPAANEATEDDYYTEFLDMIISCKVVEDTAEAVRHINKYSTHHSDTIVTSDERAAKCFMDGVDSAAVYVNAATCFTDGFEFGFGAEIGISTQKLHARGPVGLKELTSYKYIVRGNGNIRK